MKDYVEKFDMMTEKLRTLEPLVQFKVGPIKLMNEIALKSKVIPSPFVANSDLGYVESFLGRLQPYLYKEGSKNSGLGLVAFNTINCTVIGKFTCGTPSSS